MFSVTVLGWVQNVSDDQQSAILQGNIDAVEGQVISLTIYSTKNGLRFVSLPFIIEASGSASRIIII